jgi:hypothetical protein
VPKRLPRACRDFGAEMSAERRHFGIGTFRHLALDLCKSTA